jgi:hypothetical protein
MMNMNQSTTFYAVQRALSLVGMQVRKSALSLSCTAAAAADDDAGSWVRLGSWWTQWRGRLRFSSFPQIPAKGRILPIGTL